VERARQTECREQGGRGKEAGLLVTEESEKSTNGGEGRAEIRYRDVRCKNKHWVGKMETIRWDGTGALVKKPATVGAYGRDERRLYSEGFIDPMAKRSPGLEFTAAAEV